MTESNPVYAPHETNAAPLGSQTHRWAAGRTHTQLPWVAFIGQAVEGSLLLVIIHFIVMLKSSRDQCCYFG